MKHPSIKQNFFLMGVFVLCMAMIVMSGCTSVHTTHDESWSWPTN